MRPAPPLLTRRGVPGLPRFRTPPSTPQGLYKAARCGQKRPGGSRYQDAEVPTAERNGSKMYCRWVAGAALVVAGIVGSASSAWAGAGSQAVEAPAVPIVSVRSVMGPVSVLSPRAATNTAAPAGLPARPTRRYAPSVPATTVSPGEQEVAGPVVIATGGFWSGGPLQAATILSVPTAVGGLVIAFIVLQWLVDRRDPKFVEAPVHKDHDSVGFE